MRRKKTKKRKKQRPLSKLKKDVWKVFSLAIRLRDSNDKGVVKCICCNRRGYYIGDGIHAGHFMSRRFGSTFLDPYNVNGQHVYCNTYMQGNQYEYSKALDEKYGEGTAERLNQKSKETFKVDRLYLEEMEQWSLELLYHEGKKRDLWDWEKQLSAKQLKYINECIVT